jgi:intracellular sulfur oxidation DsrE/DsrF family protein
MKNMIRICTIALLFGLATAYAEPPNDADALKGVETGKVVFDMNTASAEKTALYLSVIGETVNDLVRQGVEPDVILAFRGPTVKLISKEREHADPADLEHLDKIAAQLAELQRQGVRMESCSVATRMLNVDNDQLLDGIKPVGNTFVSLTGYQAQGYAVIPIY